MYMLVLHIPKTANIDISCIYERMCNFFRKFRRQPYSGQGLWHRRDSGDGIEAGIVLVIPPKSNKKERRRYDEYLYRLRHLVENAFIELKRWRGIATRYAKKTASYLAAVHIRCLVIWAKLYW